MRLPRCAIFSSQYAQSKDARQIETKTEKLKVGSGCTVFRWAVFERLNREMNANEGDFNEKSERADVRCVIWGIRARVHAGAYASAQFPDFRDIH